MVYVGLNYHIIDDAFQLNHIEQEHNSLQFHTIEQIAPD